MPTQIEDDWFREARNVIGFARLVCVFDGTDRQSLDFLRDALYRLGIIEVEIQRMQGGCD